MLKRRQCGHLKPSNKGIALHISPLLPLSVKLGPIRHPRSSLPRDIRPLALIHFYASNFVTKIVLGHSAARTHNAAPLSYIAPEVN